jgi:hypothetical protein
MTVKCHYVEYCYAECHYAECQGTIINLKTIFAWVGEQTRHLFLYRLFPHTIPQIYSRSSCSSEECEKINEIKKIPGLLPSPRQKSFNTLVKFFQALLG